MSSLRFRMLLRRGSSFNKQLTRSNSGFGFNNNSRQILHIPRSKGRRFIGGISGVLLSHHMLFSHADSSTIHLAEPVQPLVVPSTNNSSSTFNTLLRSVHWLQQQIHTAWILLMRSLYLMLTFTPAAACCPLLLVGNESISLWWWSLLRDCIRLSGPCGTKFAQWIATRPDLFPLTVCQQLEDLQSKVYRHRWHDSEAALQLAYGEDWSRVTGIEIDWVDRDRRTPVVLGSGCVGQVIRGRVDDQPVAIKIIHPGVRQSIAADVTILRTVTWLIECLPGAHNFSLAECVEEFSQLMTDQLDLTIEANNLLRFRELFHINTRAPEAGGKTPPPAKFTFPQPVMRLVATSVLVESYEPGAQISDMLGNLHDPVLRRDIALRCLDVILKMVFEDNFIHADLHPGNIIFRRCGPGPQDWQLSFIDAGLVAALQPEDRRNFIDLFAAVIRNDGRLVGQLMIERSRGGGMNCADREGFAQELGLLVNSVHQSGLSLGKIGVAALLQKVLVLCYQHQVKLEPKFVTVILAIGVLEGLGKRLDPEIDVLLRAAPYVLRAALRMGN